MKVIKLKNCNKSVILLKRMQLGYHLFELQQNIARRFLLADYLKLFTAKNTKGQGLAIKFGLDFVSRNKKRDRPLLNSCSELTR